MSSWPPAGQVAHEREDHRGDQAAEREQHRRGDEPLELQALLAAGAPEPQHERRRREADAGQTERPAQALERVGAVDGDRVGEPVDGSVGELARRERGPGRLRDDRDARQPHGPAPAPAQGPPAGEQQEQQLRRPEQRGQEEPRAQPRRADASLPRVGERVCAQPSASAATAKTSPAPQNSQPIAFSGRPRGDQRSHHRERDERERDDEVERRRHVVGGHGEHPAGEQHRHRRRAERPARAGSRASLLSHSETCAGWTVSRTTPRRSSASVSRSISSRRPERLIARRRRGRRPAPRSQCCSSCATSKQTALDAERVVDAGALPQLELAGGDRRADGAEHHRGDAQPQDRAPPRRRQAAVREQERQEDERQREPEVGRERAEPRHPDLPGVRRIRRRRPRPPRRRRRRSRSRAAATRPRCPAAAARSACRRPRRRRTPARRARRCPRPRRPRARPPPAASAT